MMDAMQWTGIIVFSTVLAASEIGGSNVRTVYVMPMTHGLDQYVANWLTREHVFEVVADPKRADAVFTDRIGESLQYELEKLNPTPQPPEEKAETESAGKDADSKHADAKDTDAKDADANADAKDADAKDAGAKSTRHSPKMMTDDGPPRPYTSGRDRGTLFLVDSKSRTVLWSLFEKPAQSSPHELDRTAKRIVTRLKQ